MSVHSAEVLLAVVYMLYESLSAECLSPFLLYVMNSDRYNLYLKL